MTVDTTWYGWIVVRTDNDNGQPEYDAEAGRCSFEVESGPYRSEGAARQHGLKEYATVVRVRVPKGVEFE